MAIEIKQLEIRGKVIGNQTNKYSNNNENNFDYQKMKNEIINSCLEKVEDLIKKKNER
ncbi:MAG: hypothetical protein IPL95_09685 [Saprospiraceae bacterium]|nr:hypothetical protein [Saprospiraceae bacterium]